MKSQHNTKPLELLSPAAASEYLKARWAYPVAERTLGNWRWAGIGPVFRRAGRFVRYAKADLDAFAMQSLGREYRSTSDSVATHAA